MYRNRVRVSNLYVTACLAVALCSSARANIGVPMLAVVWPASWLLLIPVVSLEGWVAMRVLGIRYGEGIRLATTANLFSTLIGIPLTWVAHMLVAYLVGPMLGKAPYSLFERGVVAVLGSSWVFPTFAGVNIPSGPWQDPLVIRSAMILCVPFFLMSVAVEGWIVRKGIAFDLQTRVRRWAWRANALSYGLIEVGLGVMLLLALRR